MSLVRHKAKTHPQQGPAAIVDDRETDPDVFAQIDRSHGFTIDVAASAHNTKCERFYTVDDDGLAQSWVGEVVWCNPPYSTLRPWVEKAWRECGGAPKIVMILPANRTEQRWWQELVEPYRGGGWLRCAVLARADPVHCSGRCARTQERAASVRVRVADLVERNTAR